MHEGSTEDDEGKLPPEEGVKRGAWTSQEDKLLSEYIAAHGLGRWRSLPKNAGARLNRCPKSCRLRWLNYLRPGIKRGNITEEEEELIIRLHNLLGNRWVLSWSLIAGRLPGRTDNEIKNYWNTCLRKKATGNSRRSTIHGVLPPILFIILFVTTSGIVPSSLSSAPSSSWSSSSSSSSSSSPPPPFRCFFPGLRLTGAGPNPRGSSGRRAGAAAAGRERAAESEPARRRRSDS
ncbi:unnamed protein product [Spirodela intermedia]|uniref:Uncharacterized protein n=1 Tax=Spirodela intermedia TaxID=51605 RepID=A0A7I8JH93_SPIIN|nr:unnamed protein product [Spirodela intermedia]CAA6669529.1 unnamed protein product [Spirodela intermedia]